MRKITSFFLSMLMAIIALPLQAAVEPTVVIDQEFTDLASLDGKAFAIVNKETGKALYGSNNQNLGYGSMDEAFKESNSGYYFKLETPAQDADDESIASYHLLRLITPAGAEYNIWGEPGYINSQPATGACSFILGLVKGNGQDIKNGAVFDIQYVEGKGFTLKNIGTGMYLNDNAPAKYEEPVYWTFCTVKKDWTDVFASLFEEEAAIKAHGTSEEANAAYDAAVADVKAAVEAGTLENAEDAVQTVNAALDVLAKAQTASGSDFTRIIVNNEINGADGWTTDKPKGGNGPLLGGASFEYWAGSAEPRNEGTFDYYQVIEGLPNGKYTVSAEMYNSLNGEAGAVFDATSGVYAQSGTDEVYKLVDVDGDQLIRYTTDAITVSDGTLRLGVKNVKLPMAARWFVADNFQLTLVEPEISVPTIANPSFETDGEKAASNGPLSLSGWTFDGVGSQFNNTEIRPAGSASTTSAFGTSAPSDGEYSLFFRQGWNGNGNTITITSDALTEIPAGSYKLSVDYKQAYACDKDEQKNENTKVGVSLVNDGNVIASEISSAAGIESSTFFNDSEWNTLTAAFTADENIAAGAKVVITLYSCGAKRSDFFIDNVKFEKVASIEPALAKLESAIKSAKDEAAKYAVGDKFFQYAESEIQPLTNAIDAAQNAYDAAESVETVNAAVETLNSAVAAFAPAMNVPAADKQYVLSLKTSDENSPFQLSITAEKITIEEAGTPVSFVAQDGGKYALVNSDGEYVNYKGNNTWDLSATAEAYGWTISSVEGGYTIVGNNSRFLGTNTSNGNAAGSTCYGDKKADNGNYIWAIEEYVAPAPKPVLATIDENIAVVLPEGTLELDEDGMITVTLNGKVSLDESIAKDASINLYYTLAEEVEQEPSIEPAGRGIEPENEPDFVELKGNVDSQEIQFYAEAGKKYTLTVDSIVVYCYDDEVGDIVSIAKKAFEGDDALEVKFETKEEEPKLAEIGDTNVMKVDVASINTDEDGDTTVDVTYFCDVEVAESVKNANVQVDVTLTCGEESESASLVFDLDELAANDFSDKIPMIVEYGKDYTLTIDRIAVGYGMKECEAGYELETILAEKEGNSSTSFTTPEKQPTPEIAANVENAALAVADDEAISEEDGTFKVTFTYTATVPETAQMASGELAYTVTAEGKEPITGTTDFDVEAESRNIYVKGLDYDTEYTLTVNSIKITDMDLETFESKDIYAKTFEEGELACTFKINAPAIDIAQEFTSIEACYNQAFAIVNKETGKVLYGTNNQNLGYDTADKAFVKSNSGYYFKIDKASDETNNLLRLLTPAGAEYNIWGNPGYLNSQPATGNCSFILGLNNQNGQDIENGAVWEIEYVDGKGFTLKNVGTGLYITSNDAAKSEEPVYWTFCTINGFEAPEVTTGIDGIDAVKAANGKYIENGKIVIVKNGKKISVAGFGIK